MSRETERLTLEKRGNLWSVVLGAIRPEVLAVEGLVDSRSPLEAEHQRLGHMGVKRIMEMASKGMLEGKDRLTFKDDPFKLKDCEVCSRSKIVRVPKTGDAPILLGGGDGVGIDIDIAGPFEASEGQLGLPGGRMKSKSFRHDNSSTHFRRYALNPVDGSLHQVIYTSCGTCLQELAVTESARAEGGGDQ